MNDLMELITTCKPLAMAKQPNYVSLEKAKELKALGFEKMANKLTREFFLAEKMECIVEEKYPVITNEKIQSFLDRLAVAYNAKRAKTIPVTDSVVGNYLLLQNVTFQSSFIPSEQEGSRIVYSGWDDAPETLVAPTRDAMSSAPGTIGKFKWEETPVAKYDGIPPAHALEALKRTQDKGIFEYFTIATVKGVRDPLLLGRLDGVEDRFFLAQWGDDVALDDVI